jgi:ABC-type oligopeptide transport system ATPase subunit
MATKTVSTNNERLAVVENKLENIQNTSSEIKNKLECFIETADKKYATKEQVCAFETRCKEHINKQRSWVQWIPQLISMLIALIAFTISIRG